MGEGAAVAEGDELGEGVGTLGAAEEGGVPDLAGNLAGGTAGAGGGKGEHVRLGLGIPVVVSSGWDGWVHTRSFLRESQEF